jgi:hypothetical protein
MDDFVDGLLVVVWGLLVVEVDAFDIGLRLPSDAEGFGRFRPGSDGGAFFRKLRAFLSVGTCFARFMISSKDRS